MLTRKGKRVCVLERNAVAGGCIRTEEITLPGFRHDLFSMSYPLFVMAPYYPLLKPDLEAAGVSFVSAKLPTGVVLPDGRALVFSQSREENIAAMNALGPGDGDAYRAAMEEVGRDAPLIFTILTQEPWSWATAKTLGSELYRRGPRGLAAFFGDALPNARSWLEREFRSDLVRALIAPWILHTGLGPDDAMSALMAKVILFTLEAAGNPVVVGGSSRVVDAFRKLIESRRRRARNKCRRRSRHCREQQGGGRRDHGGPAHQREHRCDLQCHPDPALHPPPSACVGPRQHQDARPRLHLRPRRHADPSRALGPAAVDRRQSSPTSR